MDLIIEMLPIVLNLRARSSCVIPFPVVPSLGYTARQRELDVESLPGCSGRCGRGEVWPMRPHLTLPDDADPGLATSRLRLDIQRRRGRSGEGMAWAKFLAFRQIDPKFVFSKLSLAPLRQTERLLVSWLLT